MLPSVLGKDGSDLRGVRMTAAHDRSKFFEELDRTARRKGHDALARLIAHVHEGMTRPHRDMHEAPSLAAEHVIVDLHFVLALREVDRFVLVVVDVQRRTALRSNTEQE